jgi:hypothetical protein
MRTYRQTDRQTDRRDENDKANRRLYSFFAKESKNEEVYNFTLFSTFII